MKRIHTHQSRLMAQAHACEEREAQTKAMAQTLATSESQAAFSLLQLDLHTIMLDAEESGRMLQHLCDRLYSYAPFSVAWIGLANYTEHEMHCSYLCDRAEPRFLPPELSINLNPLEADQTDPAALSLLGGRTIVIEESQNDPRFAKWKSRAKFSRITSYTCFALHPEADKRPIGVLCIGSELPLHSDDATITALEAIARRMGAHLHDIELQRHLSLERRNATEHAQALHQLLDALPVGIFWKDLHLRYAGANRAFYQHYLGLTPAEAIGKSDEELGWPLGAPQLAVQERELFYGGQNQANRFEQHNKRWMLASRSLLRDGEGHPLQLAGVMVESSQLYHHYRLMQTQNKNLAKLIELLPFPICAYDQNRQIKIWNHACELLFGYSPQEALEQKLETLIMPPPQRNPFMAKLDAWFTQNRPMLDGKMLLKAKTIPVIERYATHWLLDRMSEQPLVVSIFTDKMTN
ncbi:MAG: PAS domain-containing protein [Campylobacterales bacterium]|nr:PAS domain-containing protein [Campylobacterales bacterium]